jgi:hypothetical protein
MTARKQISDLHKDLSCIWNVNMALIHLKLQGHLTMTLFEVRCDTLQNYVNIASQ